MEHLIQKQVKNKHMRKIEKKKPDKIVDLNPALLKMTLRVNSQNEAHRDKIFFKDFDIFLYFSSEFYTYF